MPIDLGTAALVGGIASAVGSTASSTIAASVPSGFSYEQTTGLMDQQKTNQMQMNIQQFGLNKAYQQWLNEYNSPEQQVQRYINAGINPMYGVTGGSSSAGNATGVSSTGSGSAASAGSGGQRMANPLAQTIGSSLGQAANTILQLQSTKTEMAKQKAEQSYWENLNKYNHGMLGYHNAMLPYQQDALAAQAYNQQMQGYSTNGLAPHLADWYDSQKELNLAQKVVQNLTANWYGRKALAEIRRDDATAFNSVTQGKLNNQLFDYGAKNGGQPYQFKDQYTSLIDNLMTRLEKFMEKAQNSGRTDWWNPPKSRVPRPTGGVTPGGALIVK